MYIGLFCDGEEQRLVRRVWTPPSPPSCARPCGMQPSTTQFTNRAPPPLPHNLLSPFPLPAPAVVPSRTQSSGMKSPLRKKRRNHGDDDESGQDLHDDPMYSGEPSNDDDVFCRAVTDGLWQLLLWLPFAYYFLVDDATGDDTDDEYRIRVGQIVSVDVENPSQDNAICVK